jgi:hypothetical protein
LGEVVLNHKTNAMKKLIIPFLSLMPVLVSAQDVLYKTDNTKEEVKVTEVNSGTIKYKAFANPDGPLYTIAKTNVVLIVYQNGQYETFKTTPVNTESIVSKKEKRFLEVTEKKNVILLNTIEFLNSGVGISYLHEFCDGKFDLHVPFAASFSSPGMDNALSIFGGLGGCKLNKTNYDIGLGLYFNTSGKKAVTHFIGPLVRNAQYSASYTSYGSEAGVFCPTQQTTSINETSLMLNNGFLYRITPHFNMMINIAVGTFIDRSFTNKPGSEGNYYAMNPYRSVALHAGFHFGYRF